MHTWTALKPDFIMIIKFRSKIARKYFFWSYFVNGTKCLEVVVLWSSCLSISLLCILLNKIIHKYCLLPSGKVGVVKEEIMSGRRELGLVVCGYVDNKRYPKSVFDFISHLKQIEVVCLYIVINSNLKNHLHGILDTVINALFSFHCDWILYLW